MNRKKLESDFQRKLKKRIEKEIPDVVIKRNNADDIEGLPDLTVYHGDKYAHLEVKRSENAPHRPNQDYYIELFKKMGGYASFVYPENADAVIFDIMKHFEEE